MGFYHTATANVIDQPTIDREWIGQHAETPVDVLVAPAGDPDVLDRPADDPRYVVEPRRSTALGRTVYRVVDRAEDGALVAWFGTREQAEDRAAAENAEDSEDLGAWWESLPTSPDLDTVWNLRSTGSPEAAEWLAEGRARLEATGSTKGDLYGHDTRM